MALKVELKLSEDEKVALSGILGCPQEKLERTLEPFASASLEEYCRMILGQKVFTRTQDIKEYRMYLLIKEVFQNKIPDDQKISDLFQTTPTESKSLIRSITSKYQYELRSAIEETLKIIIQGAKQDGVSKNWMITVNSITKIEELNKILMSVDGTLPQISKEKGTVSSYVIKPSSYKKLKTHFGL